LEDIGLPKLTDEQVAELCREGEKAAWKYVLSKVRKKLLLDVDITVWIEGAAPITVTVEVGISLSPLARGVDAERLAEEAARRASERIDELLREMACGSGG